jgi:hypothetical protein
MKQQGNYHAKKRRLQEAPSSYELQGERIQLIINATEVKTERRAKILCLPEEVLS